MNRQRQRLPKVEKCEQCARRMRRAVVDRYEYRECGLSNVVLHSIATYKCDCGAEVIGLPNVERLHDLIFQRLLMKPSPLRGEELRFLRKFIGVKAVEFAKMLNVDHTTVSKWENDHQAIGKDHDKLIRFSVVLAVTSEAKRRVEEAHRMVANQYLDFLNEIKNLVPREEAGDTVDITPKELEEVALTFRWGVVPAPPEVEVAT